MFKSALSGLEAQRNDMNEFVQQFLENPEKTTYHHECFGKGFKQVPRKAINPTGLDLPLTFY